MSEPSGYRTMQIVSLCQSLRAKLIEEDPALAEDADALMAAMGNAGSDAEELVRQIIRAQIEASTFAEAAKARAADIAERAARFKRRADHLKETAFAAMDALGIAKVADPEFTASIRAGGVQTIVTDEAAVPDEYWQTTRTLRKADINADVKVGVVIPGVEMRNGSPTLSIRRK